MDSTPRIRWSWEFTLVGSILICIGALLVTEFGYSRLQKSHEKIVREMTASARLATLLALVADAETSQRGYLLTERENYLGTFSQVAPAINP